ncbi:MAG: PorV/PorQ family protein [Ignavibacteriaceae bacterium]|nr:PorV/PorQ family protein [Ignavibacteriaceae bacterium]
MKKSNQIKIILLSVFVLPIFSFAQSGGSNGLSFLKIGSGARNIALGDNGAIFANDVSAIFYNPAQLKEGSPEIIFTHNAWIQDAATELLGVKFSLFNLPIGIGINSTSIKEIEVRTKPGPVESTFNSHYFFGSLSTAFSLVDNLSTGITVKYLYEDIFYDNAEGIAFDFGLHYKSPIENLFISGVVKNIGKMNQLQKEATKLPSEIRVGPIYAFDFPEYKLTLQAGAEFQKYLAQNDSHVNFGTEIVYDKMFALRLGYQTNYLSKDISGGLGIYWNQFSFDYAMTPFSYGLGQAQTISIKYTF